PELPDKPTIDETIPGIINIGWNGLLAPAGTPAPIIDKLNAVTVAARQDEAARPARHEQHAGGIRKPHRPRGRSLGANHSGDRYCVGIGRGVEAIDSAPASGVAQVIVELDCAAQLRSVLAVLGGCRIAARRENATFLFGTAGGGIGTWRPDRDRLERAWRNGCGGHALSGR